MDKIPKADRERELAEIEAHLEARGATRCPPAFACVVNAAVSPDEERRRLAQLKPLEGRKKPGVWAYWG
jgi:hypothetical protein